MITDTERKDIQKANFIAMVMEGTFFWTGSAFLNINTVIPVFIANYTGSIQLAGLAVTLQTVFMMLPALIMGPYMSKIDNVPRFLVRIMLFFRPLPLLMIPVLFNISSPLVVAIIFLILFSLLSVSNGIVSIVWTDLFGRTIPFTRRGKIHGYQQLFGGIGSLIAGLVIKMVMDNPDLSDPSRYAIIFGLGGLVLFISGFSFTPARDLPGRREDRHYDTSILDYLRLLPALWKKKLEFRKMMYIQILGRFAIMVLPFIILFAQDQFSLKVNQVSTLIYLQIVGRILGGILWGNISEHFGNKYVIMISRLINIFLILLAIMSVFLPLPVTPVFIMSVVSMLTGVYLGCWLGFSNYMLDIAGEEERTDLIVLSKVLIFPLSFLNYIAGIIADKVGYMPLLIISVATAAIGFLLSLRLKSRKSIEESMETMSG